MHPLSAYLPRGVQSATVPATVGMGGGPRFGMVPVSLTCVTAWILIVPCNVRDGDDTVPTKVPFDDAGQSGRVNSHLANYLNKILAERTTAGPVIPSVDRRTGVISGRCVSYVGEPVVKPGLVTMLFVDPWCPATSPQQSRKMVSVAVMFPTAIAVPGTEP